MAKHFTDEEIGQIMYLRDKERLSYEDIAKKLKRFDRKGNPAARSVMKQFLEARKDTTLRYIPQAPPKSIEETLNGVIGPPPFDIKPPAPEILSDEEGENLAATVGDLISNEPVIKPDAVPNLPQVVERKANPNFIPVGLVSLEEMTKKQRIEYMRKAILTGARGAFTFNKLLNSSEQELFLEEYFRVLQEQDSLTNAEEQQLYTAILNYVFFIRAKERDEQSYAKSQRSSNLYDRYWNDEAERCRKAYHDSIKALKLSREQRLEDMAKAGNTFLDFAELLASRESQEDEVKNIMKLEKASVDELKRMQANGWVIFGKSKNNVENVNYGLPNEVS